MNEKPIGNHRVADAFVKLLTELTDQLQEIRAQRISRRMFGLHGQGAFAALYTIREALRALKKYGASAEIDTMPVDGRVSSDEVYSFVCRTIEAECPNMDEVWG